MLSSSSSSVSPFPSSRPRWMDLPSPPHHPALRSSSGHISSVELQPSNFSITNQKEAEFETIPLSPFPNSNISSTLSPINGDVSIGQGYQRITFMTTRYTLSYICRRIYQIIFGFRPLYLKRTIFFNGIDLGDASLSSAPNVPTAYDVDSSPIFVSNSVSNQKYSLITFLPKCLYEQFSFFLNFYFLLIALSQFIPLLQIGYLFTYVLPLTVVVCVSMLKEAVDDIKRYIRDKQVNSETFLRIRPASSSFSYSGNSTNNYDSIYCTQNSDDDNILSSSPSEVSIDLRHHLSVAETIRIDLQKRFISKNGIFKSKDIVLTEWLLLEGKTSQGYSIPGCIVEEIPRSDIKIGDLIVVFSNQSIPADIVLLRTGGAHPHSNTGASGSYYEPVTTAFIRTDQLDGETDWKLRRCVGSLRPDVPLIHHRLVLDVEAPKKDIYSFTATITNWTNSKRRNSNITEPLGIENVVWGDSVLASSGFIVGCVVYTGEETRAKMNQSKPTSKVGIVDLELNSLTKLLFMLTIIMAVLLGTAKQYKSDWYIDVFRFIVLFSYIIPVSLRVNLDIAKTFYCRLISNDTKIPNTLVRTSSMPEELGRICYILTDKTGTLTCNDMVLKKLQVVDLLFSKETLAEVKSICENIAPSGYLLESSSPAHRRVLDSLLALAICHNVTPIIEEGGGRELQAASPDEVALVKFAEDSGIILEHRDSKRMTLSFIGNEKIEIEILHIFPFTSERKRMGILCKQRGRIIFYLKGADSVMLSRISTNEWVEEACENFSREGLRTLVVASRVLGEEEYVKFDKCYHAAKCVMSNREKSMADAIEGIEHHLNCLAVTGVEDKLGIGVKATLEAIHNAGVKVWCLTGDKLETATCIGRSSRLIPRSQSIFTISGLGSASCSEISLKERLIELKEVANTSSLIIDGISLQHCLDKAAWEFMDASSHCSAVVCCRVSPTQKAAVVNLVRNFINNEQVSRTCCSSLVELLRVGGHPQHRVLAIGDGGNDVSMIQAADVGVGIVGKEGMQASLAADFSVTQFCHLKQLILWHGRNSYQRTSTLAQFVIHRGLIISFIQAVFSAIYWGSPIPIYTGWLVVGYTTYYTMLPVLSLILDNDISLDTSLLYPELYRELQKGRALSAKTFLVWVWKSLYQGGSIMLSSEILFSEADSFVHIVSITFTALILTELLMVCLEIRKFKWIIFFCLLLSLIIYIFSMFWLKEYFDLNFVTSGNFVLKCVIMTTISCLPVTILKFCRRKCKPPVYAKLHN